jgi:hypothetical protein
MRHTQATLHVTRETKLSLPVEVELQASDSLKVEGRHLYSVGLVPKTALIPRNTGSYLEDLRYRFYAGKGNEEKSILSPWDCRDELLSEGVSLRECHAGLSVKQVGRGKKASLVAVRPDENPSHSWALGLQGLGGSYTLGRVGKKSRGDRPLSKVEILLDQECSGWRLLLREALTLDYSRWEGIAERHPRAWVRELFTPLPLTIETRDGAPTARVVCQSLLDVLIVTTQLDGIRGLKHRVCGADGCGRLFALGNYKDKIFCTYDCAHRQTVRNGRRRKRREINKATKSASKERTGGGQKI